MGLVLGLTLGLIGLLRGIGTPDDILGNMEKRQEEFSIKVPLEELKEVKKEEEDETFLHFFRTGNKFDRVYFPEHVLDTKKVEQPSQVLLPVGQKFKEADEVIEGKKYKVFTMPEKSQVRSAAVSRWSLGL